MAKKLKQHLIFITLSLAMLSFSAQAQVSNPQCGQRYIAQNIKSAVLALKATKYCTNISLPYSMAQASKNIDDLRCNAQASSLLDEMINDFDYQYKTIMSGAGSKAICLQAASLGKDIS
ncbi:MAG: hypothetical protein L3J15_09075 [Devosiaceae bacterium]|nr:hypothetical protein [Devosiaceae bacterium]